MKSDALQIAFRKRVQELKRLGWGVDEERLAREFTGRKACAIPSPERRNISAWAIEPIPVVAITLNS